MTFDIVEVVPTKDNFIWNSVVGACKYSIKNPVQASLFVGISGFLFRSFSNFSSQNVRNMNVKLINTIRIAVNLLGLFCVMRNSYILSALILIANVVDLIWHDKITDVFQGLMARNTSM